MKKTYSLTCFFNIPSFLYYYNYIRYASGDVPRAAELYRASIAVLPLAESLADAHTGLALALRHQCNVVLL